MSNRNPNLQDVINNLTVPPPPSQASHQALQLIPPIAQDDTQVDAVATGPSSSAPPPDLLNPTTATAHHQTQVDIYGVGPSSSIPVPDDSMAPGPSTASQQMQVHVGPALPQRSRSGWISSMISIGQDEAFNKVCDFLRDDDVGMIGIYGMGGVGKTTLMKKIRYEFLEPSNFQVTWIVVTKAFDPDKIRNFFPRIRLPQLVYKKRGSKPTDQTDRTRHEKKFAVLMDDIWEHLDLEELGILGRFGLNTSRFKIIFTTRSERVCRQMQPDREIKVECLGWDDSWLLFEKNVGKKTLESDYIILDLAKEVAKECQGLLPLALVVIGRAMTCKKTPEEWKHALTTLQKSPSEVSDVEDKLFAILKLSYDALPGHGEKECFLYCCLYPESQEMNSDWLVEYWIGEGFLALNGCFEETFNRGHDIIGNLLAACLLEKASSSRCVMMHDVIRDMGLWIGSSLKLNSFVHGSLQLTKAQIANRWSEAHRIFVFKEDAVLEEPLCLNLSTLIFIDEYKSFRTSNGFFKFMNDFIKSMCKLDEYKSIRILNVFFKSMCKLRVLEIWCVEFLDLPVAIGQLVELRYLGIRKTNLETLPREIGNLSKLEMLYLHDNMSLRKLPKTIGQLVELRKLKVSPCLRELPVELGSLSKLEILHLENFGHIEAIPTLTFQNMVELRTLQLSVTGLKIFPAGLWDLTNLEDLRVDVQEGDLNVDFINGLKRLSKSLRYLCMRNGPIASWDELLSALQNVDKLSKLTIEESPPNYKSPLWPSSCLTSLRLLSLKELRILFCFKLEKIQVNQMDLQNLRKLYIIRCISLKHIFGLQYLPGLVELTIEDGEMEELIEADDDVSFPNLKVMELRYLNYLKRICSDAVLFPSLTQLILEGCNKWVDLPQCLRDNNCIIEVISDDHNIDSTRKYTRQSLFSPFPPDIRQPFPGSL